MTQAGTAAGPRIDGYDWPGGREPLLRFGPDAGPAVIVATPLFEEGNRTRALAVAILRALAQDGIGGLLPELPGQGESLVPTQAASLAAMQAAFAAASAAARRPVYGLAIRSGALLDGAAPLAGRWRLSPVVEGRAVLRELARIRQAATGERASPDRLGEAASEPVEIGGNLLSPSMFGELADAAAAPGHSAPLRTARLAGDPHDADVVLGGSPPWRRSEPDVDAALVAGVARDVAEWIARCAG